MLNMPDYYKYLDVSLNLDDFITGKLLLFDDVSVKENMLFASLTEQSDNDQHVVVILLVVLPALTKLIQQQYDDHLTGGVHEQINRNETQSVDKHNKYPESFLICRQYTTCQTKHKYSNNGGTYYIFPKQNRCLRNKDNASEIITPCRKEVSEGKQKFKQREELIRAKRIEKQNEEFRKKEILEQKRIEKLEKETNRTFYGVWQTEQQMENALGKIDSEKEKEEGLKVQLRFRKMF